MNARSFLGALMMLIGASVALLSATYCFMLALPDVKQSDAISVGMTLFFCGIPFLFGLRLFQRGRRLYAAGDGALEGAAAPLSKDAGYQRRKSVVYLILVIVVTVFLLMHGCLRGPMLVFAGAAVAVSGVKVLLTFVETSPGAPKAGMMEAEKKSRDLMKDL